MYNPLYQCMYEVMTGTACQDFCILMFYHISLSHEEVLLNYIVYFWRGIFNSLSLLCMPLWRKQNVLFVWPVCCFGICVSLYLHTQWAVLVQSGSVCRKLIPVLLPLTVQSTNLPVYLWIFFVSICCKNCQWLLKTECHLWHCLSVEILWCLRQQLPPLCRLCVLCLTGLGDCLYDIKMS